MANSSVRKWRKHTTKILKHRFSYATLYLNYAIYVLRFRHDSKYNESEDSEKLAMENIELIISLLNCSKALNRDLLKSIYDLDIHWDLTKFVTRYEDSDEDFKKNMKNGNFENIKWSEYGKHMDIYNNLIYRLNIDVEKLYEKFPKEIRIVRLNHFLKD